MLESILNQLVNLTEIQIIIIFSILSIINGIILIPSSQIILIIAGILSISNNLNPIILLPILIITNVLGNYILYLIAYKHGEKIIKKIIPIKKKKLQEQLLVLDYLFKRYGSYIIIIGRNLPIFHSFISIPSGISKVNKKEYLIYTTIGITIWTLIFFNIGRYISVNYQTALESFEKTGPIILILVILIGWILFRKYYKETLKKAKMELQLSKNVN